MKKRWLKAAVIAALFFVPNAILAQGAGGISSKSSPGLLVTKTRVILEGKKRSDAIMISNDGTEEGVYKIELVNRRMNEDGTIENITEAKEGELFADNLLRISPRRVTLKPGEKQNIRILVRKPKELADGEYRSHLSIVASPVEKVSSVLTEDLVKENKLAIKIKANFAMTLPVIVRHGTLSSDANITDMAVVEGENGQKSLAFTINREGQSSTYGDIEVTYTNKAGKKYVLKSLAGLAVYTPTPYRKMTMGLDVPEGVTLDKGEVYVSYKEKESNGGNVIAEAKMTL